jgi:DNA primase
VCLPEGKDPDDYIRLQGSGAFRSLLESAEDIVTFYLRGQEPRLKTIEGKTEVARELFVILSDITDDLRREEYLKQIARILQLTEWTVRAEFTKQVRQREGRTPTGPTPPAFGQDDLDFVATLLDSKRLRKQVQEELAGVAMEPGPLAEVLNAVWQELGAATSQQLPTEEALRLYTAAAIHPPPSADRAESLVHKRVARLRRESLAAERPRISEALREAVRLQDRQLQNELASRMHEVDRQIERIGAT